MGDRMWSPGDGSRKTRKLVGAERAFFQPFGTSERQRDKADARRQIESLKQGESQIDVLRYMADRLRDLQLEQMETNRLLVALLVQQQI